MSATVDIATLGLEIRSDGVVVASDRLKRLQQEGAGAEGATNRLTSMFDKLKTVLGMVAGAMAALKMLSFVTDTAMLAARVETLGVVMGVVGNNAGYTSAQMEQYAKSVAKMGITTEASRQAVITMAQAHIDLSKSTELARIAQDAAVIGNINSSEAFERMIGGIQRGETEVLRTIGINVNFEASYRKLATQLKKNSDELTEQEKVQARTNAVMEKGKDIAGSYEAAMGTAGKQVNSLKRYHEELKLTLGEVFRPALAEAVDSYTKKLKGLHEYLSSPEARNTLKSWGESFKETLEFMSHPIDFTLGKAGFGPQAYRKDNSDWNTPVLDPSEAARLKVMKDNAEAVKIASANEARALDEANEKAATALKKKTELFKQFAEEYVRNEETRLKKAEELEKATYDKAKKNYDDKVNLLQDFASRSASILQSMEDRDRADRLKQQEGESNYNLYLRQLQDIANQQREIAQIDDPLKRAEKYNALVDQAAQYNREIKDGEEVVVTAAQAETNYLNIKRGLYAQIKDAMAEAKAIREADVAAAQVEMETSQKRMDEYKKQLEELSNAMHQLQDKNVQINIQVTGMNQIYDAINAAKLMEANLMRGGVSASASVSTPGSGYYEVDGQRYNYDTPLASYASGTDYVPRTGLYQLHQGEKVVPAEKNAESQSVTIEGGLTVITQATDAKSLVRDLIPEFRRLGVRVSPA